MRSSIVAAALVVGSFAIPAQHQPRALVTDWDVVYETQIVTVTAAGPAPAPTQAPAPAPQYGSHRPHGTQHKQPVPGPKPQPAPAPAQQPAPAPQPKPAPAPQPQPAPAPVYSPQPAPKPAPSSGEPSGYNDRCVWHHNQHRANHSAADITWSNSLASTARKIAETCVYAHSMDVDGGNYGQNIAAGIEGDKVGEVITGLFYNGEFSYFDSLFGLADPDMALFHKWGHLTQVVWKGTTQVGCYTADCSGRGLANVGPNTPAQFTVCNYGPPGNYEGQYGKNVGKPLGRAALVGYNP